MPVKITTQNLPVRDKKIQLNNNNQLSNNLISHELFLLTIAKLFELITWEVIISDSHVTILPPSTFTLVQKLLEFSFQMSVARKTDKVFHNEYL